MKAPNLCLMIALLCTLTACDRLGIPDPAKAAEAKEAEGKAIGAACRHAGRALEDCYAMNSTALKAAVFTGWKEMNDYMAENKIETVKPELAGAKPATAAAEDSAPAAEESAPRTTTRRRSARAADSGSH